MHLGVCFYVRYCELDKPKLGEHRRLVNQNEEYIIIRQTFKTTRLCCVAQQQICIKSFIKYIYLMTADYQLIEDVFALNCFA